MTVCAEYYSDLDPDTRFPTKKEADEHDKLMEQCEALAELLKQAADGAEAGLSEEQSWAMARTLLVDPAFIEAVTGKRPRKASAGRAQGGKDKGADAKAEAA